MSLCSALFGLAGELQAFTSYTPGQTACAAFRFELAKIGAMVELMDGWATYVQALTQESGSSTGVSSGQRRWNAPEPVESQLSRLVLVQSSEASPA
jgi:hypothetical protein